MKTLLITALISISSLSFGQVEVFFKSVEKQDMSSISNLLMDEVEICIKDDQRIMSKAQATKTIREFLNKIKPTSVTPLHSGSSGVGSNYKVAKMESADGVYRIFVYMESANGKEMIREARFDTF